MSRSSSSSTSPTERPATPTPDNPFYADSNIGRDRSQVLKSREADWEAVCSERSRFVLQTSKGMYYQGGKDKKYAAPSPMWWKFAQLEEMFGTETMKQATAGDDVGNLLAWAGKLEEHDYWVYYVKDLDLVEQKILPMEQLVNVQQAGLREFGDSLLSSTEAAILATCNGLVEFHKSHPFCSKCGSKTRTSKAGGSRKCTSKSCGASIYPRIDVASIMLITSQCEQYALLGRKEFWPKGRYSTLAGFAEIGETMEQCCIRETLEESGIKVDPKSLSFVCSQPWPFPRSLMVGFRAKAAEPGLPEICVEEDEMESIEWFRKDYVRERLEGGSTALTFEPSEKEQEFHIPGPASLARILISQWANET